ncbi:MAG: single-stranded DNA-binding protein [Eubacteriales bacterium]|nr:single-stranded DNA-binding protein [Eubacteriales bacterium]
MNSVILMGRLTRDPEVRYANTANGQTAFASYRLAVDRRFKREGQPDADFFECTCIGRAAEFAEKYLHQGTKMVVQGRLQNDNYQDKDGKTVYRTRVIIENQEFAESKSHGAGNAPSGQNAPSAQAAPAPQTQAPQNDASGFMNYPEEEELPWSM